MTTIMILDDHELVRDGLKAVLEVQEDLRVIGDAGSPEDLKTLLRSYQPMVLIVDMVIDGILMGYDIIEYVAKRYPEIKILAITMLWEKEYAERAFELGALGFLPKKDASSALINAVRTVASGERYVSQNFSSLIDHSSSFFEDVSSLTRREKEIFSMIGKGKTNKEIADAYQIRGSTVSSHLENIKRKMRVANLKELTQKAVSYLMKYGSD
ncbi:MAG: response regulator transcription factor [Sphaerochaetaceae bacterium]|nr:response regulator transcription factor [Sphaerochaetaceae bacterium]